jgi:2-polyprenyl-6-hydroxyphenyl methylase/3-demethylubiquinone-9 3-methyltransferase
VRVQEEEVRRGERFDFGRNWRSFLSSLTDERIEEAERSLSEMLACDDFSGKTLLDIGCGSGLFSLAARRLGARVRSFDYDPLSVGCARELKRRYFPDDDGWTVEEGSVLDREYLRSLGVFDVVYSWGVLHHTGKMWQAMENALLPVKRGGLVFIAIYNDQGFLSRFWRGVKKTYCGGGAGKAAVAAVMIPWFFLRAVAAGIVRYGNPAGQFLHYGKERGMSLTHDWLDWLGGYPFEVAKPEEVNRFFQSRDYTVVSVTTTRRQGCNQFVFRSPPEEI